jgi:hypothetical protein
MAGKNVHQGGTKKKAIIRAERLQAGIGKSSVARQGQAKIVGYAGQTCVQTGAGRGAEILFG